MKRSSYFAVFFVFSFVIFNTPIGVYAQSSEKSENIGGDRYVAGSSPSVTEDTQRDLFVSGFSPSLEGETENDAHAAGFNIDVEGPVGEDLYAAGFNISIESSIGEDLTAAAFNVDLEESASVGGNVRISAANITLDAPLSGSLIAAAGSIQLNSPIAGDVKLTSSEISFGSNARIEGELTYASPNKIDIPSSVISEDRVTFEPITERGFRSGIREAAGKSSRSIWVGFFGELFDFVGMLFFLMIVASILLLLMPNHVERGRQSIAEKPWKMLLLGFSSLSLFCGLIVTAVIVLIGIPLVPVIILLIFLIWLFGFLLGVYAFSWQLFNKVRPMPDTTMVKLGVLSVGLLVALTVCEIPIIGWLVEVVIMLFGVGAIVLPMVNRWFKPSAGSEAETTANTSHMIAD